MTRLEIKNFIGSITSLFGFDYKGIRCSVEPYNQTRFELFCGDSVLEVNSIDRVMGEKFFMGKSLNEIADEIEVTES